MTLFQKVKEAVWKENGLGNKKTNQEDDLPANDAVLAILQALNMPIENTQQQNMVSTCQSSDEFVKGIVGILEGFGLLDQKAEGSALPDEAANIIIDACENALQPTVEIVQQEQAVLPQEDTTQTNQQPIAWVPVENKPVQLEAQLKLEKFIVEYLGSLENTSSEASEFVVIPQNETTSDMLMQSQTKEETVELPLPTEKTDTDTQPVQVQLPIERPVVMNAAMKQESTMEQAGQVSQQDMADNITNLIERITVSSMNNTQEFQVDLKPEFLGKLSVKLVMDGDGIRAQIKAADASVKGLIQAEAASLADSLKERGVNITQVEVTYEASTFDFNSQQGQGQAYSEPSRQQQMGKEPEAESYDSIIESLNNVDLIAKNSSVEFRA
ncbi:flagellar hook-length control protein FliK [Clostridia bacterium OttesenSCG-928-F22]|nr:flagellar hook-length control protein FliK [Clostridia bacterium OttesenSCG-928-F22]